MYVINIHTWHKKNCLKKLSFQFDQYEHNYIGFFLSVMYTLRCFLQYYPSYYPAFRPMLSTLYLNLIRDKNSSSSPHLHLIFSTVILTWIYLLFTVWANRQLYLEKQRSSTDVETSIMQRENKFLNLYCCREKCLQTHSLS